MQPPSRRPARPYPMQAANWAQTRRLISGACKGFLTVALLVVVAFVVHPPVLTWLWGP